MPRRSANTTPLTLPLFPFLAVFLCAAGALVTLVYGYEQEGRRIAVETSKVILANSQVDEITIERESLEWRISHLQQSREKTQQNLAGKQRELSHVEDHLRRLREQANRLQLAADELVRQGGARSQQLVDTEAELHRLRRAIVAAQQKLKEKELAAQDRPVTYSVVPYEGPNQTKRRPIYIECRPDSVIIQPEGVILRDQDFEPPLGPGNPLAAAIRAYGENLSRAGFTGETTRPYPMLLVRPDGIEAYYAARAALTSWGTEFGYELVGADWTLDFPPSDGRIAENLEQIIADARLRKEALAVAAPRQFKRPRGALRASRNGGFVSEEDYEGANRYGGSGFASRQGRGSGFGEPAQSDGAGWGTGPSRDSGFGSGGAETAGGLGAGGETADETGFGSDGPGSELGQYTQGSGSGDSRYQNDAQPGGGKDVGSAAGGFSDQPTASGDMAGVNDPMAGRAAGAQAGGSQTGSQKGHSDSRYGQMGPGNGGVGEKNELGPLGSTGQGFQSNSAKMAGGGSAGSQIGGSSGASSPSSSAASGGSSGGNEATSGSPEASAMVTTPPPNKNRPKSIASNRGRDWGLPEGSSHMTPVTRPVIIRCDANQLTIVPDDARTLPKTIPLGTRTEDSVDKLVSGVWDHMKDWGLAGRGMYWRPTLSMEVAPGGESRFQELQALLHDSGMEVKQRQKPTTERRRR